jgi:hypothetical protein
MFQLGDKPFAAPKLNVVPIDKLLCPCRSIRVTFANEGSKINEMPVSANNVGAILCHREIPRWMGSRYFGFNKWSVR